MKLIKLVGILVSVLIVIAAFSLILTVTADDKKDRSPPLAGDVNLDGCVTLSDLAELLAHYGMTSGAYWEIGDVHPYPDGDGDVDLSDLAELLGHYGECQ